MWPLGLSAARIRRYGKKRNVNALRNALSHENHEIQNIAEMELINIVKTCSSESIIQQSLEILIHSQRLKCIVEIAVEQVDSIAGDLSLTTLKAIKDTDALADAACLYFLEVLMETSEPSGTLQKCTSLLSQSYADLHYQVLFRKKLARMVKKQITNMCYEIGGMTDFIRMSQKIGKGPVLNAKGYSGMLARELVFSFLEENANKKGIKIREFGESIYSLNINFLDDALTSGLKEGRKALDKRLSQIEEKYQSFPDFDLLRRKLLECIPRFDAL
jgi:hypothetical protein